jgi:hypothetical protein
VPPVPVGPLGGFGASVVGVGVSVEDIGLNMPCVVIGGAVAVDRGDGDLS